MFDRMARGWELVKGSWTVLKLDKELLLFPFISGIACLVVLASFAVPLWNTGYLETVMEEEAAGEPLGWVILFAFYVINYFVIIFFNAALIGCAIIRFKGGDPTVADGFRAASARLPQILAWAVVSATVGIVLRIIESRSERAGRFVVGLLGMAWSVMTYFVIPVIVIEKAGPVEATKRSVATLRKTWGEALTANFGIGLIVFLAMLIAAVPLILGVVAVATGMAALGIAGIVLGVGLMILVGVISSALDGILIGALYLYAAEGEVPRHFDGGLLRSAFGSR
ncbi:MAG: DUF6159 family protein [Planctomycetota bacterium]